MTRVAFNLVVPLLRSDADKREVYGFLSVARDASGATVTDSHGSQISVDDLDRMAHRYLVEARGVGEQHERFDGIGHVIESVVFTREKQAAIPPKGIPEGHVHEGWWVGFRVDDPDTWGRLKRGELTGLSIGGWARREPGPVQRSAAGAPDAPPVHTLTDLEIVEGSLVDMPANPLCTVALFKRAGAAPASTTAPAPTPAPNRTAERPMFEGIKAAIAALKKRIVRSDAPSEPPSTNQLLLQDAFHEQWEALYGAYSTSCWAIFDAGMALPDMLQRLASSTAEFLAGMEKLRESMGPGADALDVVQMDAALGATLARAADATDRESMRAVLTDLTTTVKGLAPRPPKTEPGAEAPTEKSMSQASEVQKALDVEKAARIKAEEEVAKLRGEKEAAEKAARDAQEKAEDEALQKRAARPLAGLTTDEVLTLLRGVKGTPLDALVEKAIVASAAMVRAAAQPTGEGAPNANTTDPVEAWTAAVKAIQTDEKVAESVALSRAITKHPDLWRAYRKASASAPA